jgi:hypothetical protein
MVSSLETVAREIAGNDLDLVGVEIRRDREDTTGD